VNGYITKVADKVKDINLSSPNGPSVPQQLQVGADACKKVGSKVVDGSKVVAKETWKYSKKGWGVTKNFF